MNKQHSSTSADQSSSAGQASRPSAKPADSIVESVQTLVDQGAEAIDQIKTRVGEVTSEAKTKGTAVYQRTSELVKEHPLKSLALAFGIGYVAMRITTSKLTSIAMIAGVIYAGSRLIRS